MYNQTVQRNELITYNLCKAYKAKEAVKDIHFKIHSGEVVGLLGPNGAGKTTTFYMIVGLIAPSKGKICLDGKDITHLPMYQRARMGIGYLPQESSVFKKLTVYENIQAIVEYLELPKHVMKAKVDMYLKELDLEKVSQQKAYTLSGGERRRLEITRALVMQPKFLLMDEPFSGVDPISVTDVQKIILSLKKKNIGVVITDHNVRETLRIVDRAYLMYEGCILSEGTSQFLVNNDQNRKLYLGENFNL